jgi:hypothetical protein
VEVWTRRWAPIPQRPLVEHPEALLSSQPLERLRVGHATAAHIDGALYQVI